MEFAKDVGAFCELVGFVRDMRGSNFGDRTTLGSTWERDEGEGRRGKRNRNESNVLFKVSIAQRCMLGCRPVAQRHSSSTLFVALTLYHNAP